MREDMFKVIVERPRGGWRSAPLRRKKLAGEYDLPQKIGVRRLIAITQSKTKWLNENLQPLKRYLGRQLGRPWNDVYSEISATLDPGHTVKQHVRQHLDDFVARNIIIDRNGKWMRPHSRWGGIDERPWRQRYYVDPVDGLLKDSEVLWKKLKIDPRPWRRTKPKADPNVRRLEPLRDLLRLDGIWYEVIYEKSSEPHTNELVFDLVQRTLVPIKSRHAVAKRQLSRSELKSHGIANS